MAPVAGPPGEARAAARGREDEIAAKTGKPRVDVAWQRAMARAQRRIWNSADLTLAA